MADVVQFEDYRRPRQQSLVDQAMRQRTRSGNIHWDMTRLHRPWYDADDVWAGRQEGLDAR